MANKQRGKEFKKAVSDILGVSLGHTVEQQLRENLSQLEEDQSILDRSAGASDLNLRGKLSQLDEDQSTLDGSVDTSDLSLNDEGLWDDDLFDDEEDFDEMYPGDEEGTQGQMSEDEDVREDAMPAGEIFDEPVIDVKPDSDDYPYDENTADLAPDDELVDDRHDVANNLFEDDDEEDQPEEDYYVSESIDEPATDVNADLTDSYRYDKGTVGATPDDKLIGYQSDVAEIYEKINSQNGVDELDNALYLDNVALRNKVQALEDTVKSQDTELHEVHDQYEQLIESSSRGLVTSEEEDYCGSPEMVIDEGTVIEGNIISKSNVIIKGQVVGNVSTSQDLYIEGPVEGDVLANNVTLKSCVVTGDVVAKGSVDVESDAMINGDVSAARFHSNGKVKGNLVISEAIMLDEQSVVSGNIKARTIQTEVGAKIKGTVSIFQERPTTGDKN